MNVRVLLADDDALMRAGLGVVLDNAAGIDVVGEAGDGIQAVEQCRVLTPDVALMDVRMPGVDGIEATRRVVAAGLPTRVLVLTTFRHDEYVWGALRAGASGFLLKRASPERLVDAVHTVAAGETLLDPAVTRDLVEHFVLHADRSDIVASDDARRVAALTQRELQVLRLIAQGLSNDEIAGLLVHRRVHRQDPRQAHPGESRRSGPSTGGRPRVPVRSDDPGRHHGVVPRQVNARE